MFWGHPVSIMVVGRNKIVADLEEAFHLIRHVIAPNHIYIKAVELGGKKLRTPVLKKENAPTAGPIKGGAMFFPLSNPNPARQKSM